MKTTTYNLQISTDCNHRCKICMAADFIRNARGQNFKDIQKEISGARNSGYKNVDFVGAEPTLYPKLFETIQYARSLGLRCAMCTNGNLFFSLDYTMNFLKFQPISIRISFHSHDRDTFDRIAGVKGSYDKVLRGIENINKYLKTSKVNSAGIKIKNGRFTSDSLKRFVNKNFLLVTIPICRFNYKVLPEMVQFLYKRNIRAIKFVQLALSGDIYSNPDVVVGLDSLQPYLSKAVALAKKLRMIYFFGRLPVCILEKEAEHFIELHDDRNYIKFTYCNSCKHNKKCCGIGKLSLIAKYGRKLLKAKDLFPKGFFRRFFTKKDIAFIKKYKPVSA